MIYGFSIWFLISCLLGVCILAGMGYLLYYYHQVSTIQKKRKDRQAPVIKKNATIQPKEQNTDSHHNVTAQSSVFAGEDIFADKGENLTSETFNDESEPNEQKYSGQYNDLVEEWEEAPSPQESFFDTLSSAEDSLPSRPSLQGKVTVPEQPAYAPEQPAYAPEQSMDIADIWDVPSSHMHQSVSSDESSVVSSDVPVFMEDDEDDDDFVIPRKQSSPYPSRKTLRDK